MYSSDIPQHRQRNPVVKVFLESNPERAFSLTVPKNKSWEEFLEKCADRLQFDIRNVVTIYAITEEDERPLDKARDMKKIKHGTTLQICVVDAPEESSSEEEPEVESDSLEQEVSRRPLDVFHRLNHLKPKIQKIRKQLWKEVNRHDWTYLESSESNHIFEYEDERLELSRKLIRDAPESIRLRALKDITTCIILCHGGQFAGGIFRGPQCFVHKTLSRYVVRRKQGGRQGTYVKTLAKGGGRSAGGWLRSFQERKLHEDIVELLSSWRDHFDECETILVHAPGTINRATIFGDESPLSEDDPRVSNIPIQTNTVKYNEVKRIHFAISTAHVVALMEDES